MRGFLKLSRGLDFGLFDKLVVVYDWNVNQENFASLVNFKCIFPYSDLENSIIRTEKQTNPQLNALPQDEKKKQMSPRNEITLSIAK